MSIPLLCQWGLVAEAVGVYKAIRADLAEAEPFWPLGLPGWADSWVALGLRAPGRSYVLVPGAAAPTAVPPRARRATGPPCRAGACLADPEQARLPVPRLAGAIRVDALFPDSAITRLQWDPGRAELVVTLPDPPAACLVRFDASPGSRL